MQHDMFKDFISKISELNPRKMTHGQIQLMFEVLCSGAFRISEVLQLIPEDILPNGKIRLRETKGGWKRCKCSKWKFGPMKLIKVDKKCKKCLGKGKFRVIQYGWIQPNILEKLKVLAEKTDKDNRLFPITRKQAWNYANQLVGARTHTFRHTWLTWLLESEKFNKRDIKQKARHTSIATTGEYIEDNTDFTQSKEKEIMHI